MGLEKNNILKVWGNFVKKLIIAVVLVIYLAACESHMSHIKKYSNESEKTSIKEERRRDSYW